MVCPLVCLILQHISRSFIFSILLVFVCCLLLSLLFFCFLFFPFRVRPELETKRERERLRAFEESRWEEDPDFDDVGRRAKLRALYVIFCGQIKQCGFCKSGIQVFWA